MNYEAAPRAAGLWVRLLACLVSSRRASTRQARRGQISWITGSGATPPRTACRWCSNPRPGRSGSGRSQPAAASRVACAVSVGSVGSAAAVINDFSPSPSPPFPPSIGSSTGVPDTKVPPSARRYDPPAISRMNRLEDRPISAGPVKHKEARKNCSGEDAYAIAGNAMHRRSQHLTPACRYLSFVHGSRQPKTQRNAPTTRTSSTSAPRRWINMVLA